MKIIKIILKAILVILILLPKKLIVESNITQELTSWKVLLPKCYFLSVNQITCTFWEVEKWTYFLKSSTYCRKLFFIRIKWLLNLIICQIEMSLDRLQLCSWQKWCHSLRLEAKNKSINKIPKQFMQSAKRRHFIDYKSIWLQGMRA